MNIFKETWKRMGAEKPRYFKKIAWFFYSLAAAATAVLAGKMAGMVTFEQWWTDAWEIAWIIGTVGSIFVQLPVKDPVPGAPAEIKTEPKTERE